MARSRWVGKTVTTLVVLAAIGGGAWWWLGAGREAPTQLETVPVQRGPLVQVVTATGQLEPVVSVDVSSQISGRIMEVLVDYNTLVKRGDVLARIDPATYEAAVVQAENELLNAKANLKLVRANADRTQRLYDQKLVAQAELDSMNAQLEQAEVQIRIREAALESRKTDLDRCTLLAPIDGIVIDRLAEAGKMVAASLNAPTLFTIANDLSKMQINASVAEADIGAIKESQPVEFTVDAFPNDRFRGRVSQIRNLPVTQQNVVVYATIIDVSNEQLKLKPGMTANVSIQVERRDNALRVSNAALRARVPAELVSAPPAPGGANANAAKAATKTASATAGAGGDSRDQFRALLREAGFTPGSGAPSPEVIARVRQLATDRGIELPERFGGGGRNATAAVVKRTVYRLVQPGPRPKIEAVTAEFGISDGLATEVVSGLNENDVLVTAVNSGARAGGAAPSSNPFGGGFRRF